MTTPPPVAAVWPTAAATGHRPKDLPADVHSWVRSELARVACKLRDGHATTSGVSGMALGTDMWWAQAVLDAGLDLWAYVPFPRQTDRWPPGAQRVWRRLVDQATQVHCTADKYSVAALHLRNQQMVDAAHAVVAVWDPGRQSGGTYSAVRKTRAAGLPIVHINPAARRTGLLAPTGADAGSLL